MRRRSACVWLLVLLLPILGCKGCSDASNPSSPSSVKAEDAKKKKQRLVADELRALPFATEVAGNLVKPGHWYQLRNKLKANFGDESLTASVAITNREGIPVPPTPSASAVEYKRNVSLAVGQEKVIDVTVLHPDVVVERRIEDGSEKPATSIRTRFSLRGIGTPVLEETFPNKFMEGYQYNLVVLSRDMSRYTFWRGLDCIVWRRADDLQENRIAPYRVIDISEDELASHFPSRLATMTSISHLVVNDLSLSGMSDEQQAALADWLHFGGTIIVNGPEAVAGIENSQLKDWVPLQGTSEGEWTEAEQRAFDRQWSIRIAGGELIPFQSDRKIPILTGTLAPGAAWVPTLEGLVADRLVGQGRVVMTTFPMTDAAFLRWPSYSSLIHNGILRKPHRTPKVGTEASTLYADAFEGAERNPILSTRLRLWARDFDASMMRGDRDALNNQPADGSATFLMGKSTSLGAWNAESRILEQASTCLRETSGIAVPQVATILKLLIGYLVVLVPINWLVFRLIGRVELAWLAAPIIALVGAVVVARSVQLDVGFSRSQTGYGFLECHNDYSRGMLSTYTSLYTSLSTNYLAVYKDGEGLVAPMPRAAARKGINEGDALDYWLADERGSGLQRFPVLSNSIGMIQSEEMVAFGGPLRWSFEGNSKKITADNDLGIAVRDVGVLGINEQGALVAGWLGTLEPGQSAQIDLEVMPADDRWFEQWNQNPVLKKPNLIRSSDGALWSDEPLEDVYLGPMLLSLAQRYPLQKGEIIALGWTDANPSKMEVSPAAIQKKHKTLVLMHLKAGMMADVRPDTRIFASKDSDEDQN